MSSALQMRVATSPNQSVNPPARWEAEETAAGEPAAVEDANVENLYLMGKVILSVSNQGIDVLHRCK